MKVAVNEPKKQEKQNEQIKKIEQNKNTFVQKLLNVLKNNSIFLIGVILLVYKGLFLNCLLKLQINVDVIIYTTIISILIASPIINNKKKFGYIYLNIVYTIITIVIYANFLYYNYSTNFISLYQIENVKYAKEIGSGLFTIINIKNILLFWFDNIILLCGSIFAYKKFDKTKCGNKIIKTVLIIFIFMLNIFVVKEKINDIYTSKGYNKSLIVQDASIYYYHYEDFKDYILNIFVKEEVDEQRLKDIYEENLKYKDEITKYSGIVKDSNVIILQLESLNEYIIGKKVSGKEITPNLNRFFKDNIYCTDMYNQGLGTTADSEFEMENSMYPLENGYVFQKYYDNTWLDIYTAMKDNGYYTSFMHPNTSTFWNREEVYNVGYKIDEYNDINKFPNIEQAGEFYSDEGFFEEAVDIMNSYDRKFCTTLVSVTTHIPFYLTGVSDLENKLTINSKDIEQYESEIFRNYILSCNFVDYAFGKFIDKLEKTGLIENSIIVVYGDHGAGITDVDQIEKLYLENDIQYTEFEDCIKDIKIPFGIKIPTLNENYEIQNTMSKIDIKPTLLDLLGLEDKFSLGNSIFTNKDYSFIKGLGYITSKNYYINGIYHDRQTLEKIEETKETKDLINKMENEIYLSDMIIKNNLIER